MHGEHLLIDGEKMSKKKGNILYLRSLLDEGYLPGDVRFYLIYAHYRSTLNLTRKRVDENARMMETFRDTVSRLCPGCETRGAFSRGADSDLETSLPKEQAALLRLFEERMNDDLDVRGAFDQVHDTLKDIEKETARRPLTEGNKQDLARVLRRIDGVLQVM
jgi:cysteinyl-tRNA synthetase